MAGIVGAPLLGATSPAYAWAFVGVVAFTFVVTAAQQFAIAVERREEQARLTLQLSSAEAHLQGLEAAHRRLPDLIRTMPEEDFLHRLGGTVEQVFLFDGQAVSKADMLKSLGLRLHGISRLAAMFDRAGDGFCANAMLFVEGDEAIPWWSNVLFDSEGVALAGLRGLLVLPHEITSTSDAVLDPNVAEIALPVPLDPGSARSTGGSGWKVLPGAPFVFSVDTRFELFEGSKDIDDWCEREGDHPAHVRRKLREYFEKAPFSGFLSMPLYPPSADYNVKRTPIGVVNIHWGKIDRLRQREAVANFVAGLSPLRILLANRLTRLRAEHGPPKPTAGREPPRASAPPQSKKTS